MPTRKLTPGSVPKTYADLRREVEAVVFAGRQKIEQAWLLTYHDTGRLIQEHLLLNQDRADYGGKLFARLAEDTGISKRTLHERAQIYRCFPIVRATAQLTRTHYVLLCQVEDTKQRAKLVAQVIKHAWSVSELTTRVRTFNASLPASDSAEDAATDSTATPDLLKPKRGTPGFYPLVSRTAGSGAGEASALAVDLGFKMFLPLASLPGPALRGAKAGDIVHADADGRVTLDAEATKADLYTYRALEVRVVDGDTLAVTLALPPFNHIDKKLRLRGLNCPEMDTDAGKAAKRFVQSLIRPETEVIVTTTKPDKYDRYLADVFLVGNAGPLKGESSKLKALDLDPDRMRSGSQLSTLSSQLGADSTVVFLNNALLENGHAVRMDPDAPVPLLG